MSAGSTWVLIWVTAEQGRRGGQGRERWRQSGRKMEVGGFQSGQVLQAV
jgi:hypothetical protein